MRPRPPRGLLARARARRRADARLRFAPALYEHDPSLAWRAAELRSPRERLALARSLHGIVRDIREPLGSLDASPLNHRDLIPHADAVEALAQRVGDLERPVAAAGIVLVRDLVTDGSGPLYVEGRIAELPGTLARIHAALEAA